MMKTLLYIVKMSLTTQNHLFKVRPVAMGCYAVDFQEESNSKDRRHRQTGAVFTVSLLLHTGAKRRTLRQLKLPSRDGAQAEKV